MPAVSNPDFIIGVFGQPVSSFEKWKTRGINTLIHAESEGGRISKKQWEDAATAAGLFFMDYPAPTDDELRLEARQPMRLAWMQNDEPDLNRWHADKPPEDPANAWLIDQGAYKGWTKPQILQTRYAQCKTIAPDIPVFVNFAGTAVTPVAYTHGLGHKPYIDSADWLGHDWYVKNRNAQRYPIDFIGLAIDKLAQWSASPTLPTGKPQLAFIECSAQGISAQGRCPTADEVEEEIDLAVKKGACGIVYFPQRISPGFSFDAIPPEIEARILQINRRFAKPPSTDGTLDAAVQRMHSICNRVEALLHRFETGVEARISISWEAKPPE